MVKQPAAAKISSQPAMKQVLGKLVREQSTFNEKNDLLQASKYQQIILDQPHETQ